MTPPPKPRPGRARRRQLVAPLLVALFLVTACSSGGGDKAENAAGGSGGTTAGATGGNSGSSPSASVNPAQVTVTPADAAVGVDVVTPVVVEIGEGDKLQSVKLTNSRDEEVDGKLQDDGKTWKPDVPFTFGSKYTVTAVAVNTANQPTTAVASFTTVSNDNKITASFYPDNGQTVGVGQPVSIKFNAPVKDKAAVEKALTVTATPSVQGSWHWFGSQRVDYRPKEYWPVSTQVKVDLNLRGIDAGNGAKFEQFKSFTFKVSDTKTVSVVDVDTKTMKVYKNDQVVKEIPITSGEVPNYATWGGKMVVMEKYEKTRMNSQTVGLGDEYDIDDVPWAVRTTTSGTFVHGNYWADPASTFGKQNTSHGCVSMAPDNAKWFYDNAAMPGDIVDVVNAKERVVSPDNGYGDWNLTWEAWVQGSAVQG
ncbi:Ig-like domain-containing protein [Yinghuangia sp. ASG 101]|uniref:L,D-transpeptidase n=1 Tax=Yinghuangia sp. ASG 101 TaxID=2896848 RepID=UPI001E3D4CC6|nr:Ig-like domain-containing protein [Yinghuangia sp. ASG 101]UGQ14203.1 Ig-like domain-containing protein [Yinghuangia sp. ASG 101]